MTQLSRSAILGIGKETSPGAYATPTAFLPFTKADFTDSITEIKDQSIRANDSVLQGMYAGPISADWTIDLMAYPDLVGWFLRSIVGPDTVVAGASTTLSASTLVGATSISTAVSIPVGTIVKVGTGVAVEYAKVTATSGTGPYNLTITTADSGPVVGLVNAHASADPVVAASTHTFKQDVTAPKATYSLTVFDTLATYGYSDCVFSDLQIKIDPKAAVTLNTKAKSFPAAPQTAMTPAFTPLPPALGWQWLMTNAGASSDRGLSYDVTIKRAVDVIHSSDGTQGPREIFQGALEADGSYKAIFENTSDLNLYLKYLQMPATAKLQQPVSAGGASLDLTMSKSGWSKGTRDWGSDYVQASFSLSGIWNTTDGGSIAAVLKNFQTTAY